MQIIQPTLSIAKPGPNCALKTSRLAEMLSAAYLFNEPGYGKAFGHSTLYPDTSLVLTNGNGTARTTTDKGDGINLVAASSQYLQASNNSPFVLTGTSFTWMLRFRQNVSAVGQLFAKFTSGTNPSYFCQMSAGGNLTFTVQGGGSGNTTPNIGTSPMVWYTAFFWLDIVAATLKGRVVGKAPVSTTYSITIGDGANFIVGARDNGPATFFNGVLDCLYLWKRVLSAKEQDALAVSPYLLFSDTPKIFYSFVSGYPGAYYRLQQQHLGLGI